MDIDQGVIVAIAGLTAGVATTWLGLRGQRQTLHDDRLWAKRTETYEAYIAFALRLSKQRDEQMRAAAGLVDPDPPDAEDDAPMMNRLMLYASHQVRDALIEADHDDRLWRRAYAVWQAQDEDSNDPQLDGAVRAAADLANLATVKVLETIRRELLTGRPRRIRLPRRVARDVDTRLGAMIGGSDPKRQAS